MNRGNARRTAVSVVLFAAVLFGVPVGGAAQTVITWAVPDVAEEMAAREAQMERYQELNPDVRIEIIPISDWEFNERLIAMFAGGTAPDLFVAAEVLIPYTARNGLAANLTPYVQRDNYDLSDFFPRIIEFLTIDGGLYALTDNFDAQMMYVNTTMFDERGVDTPDMTWTWDDFLNAAKSLTVRESDGRSSRHGVVMNPWWAPVFSFIWQNGGSIFAGDLSRTTIDDPQTISALQWITDLFYEYRVAPSPTELFERMGSDEIDYFTQGRAGMMIGHGRWMAKEFHETISNFDWEIAALPKQETHATFFHLSTYQMSATTEHPDETWDFLKFLVGVEGQAINARWAFGIPSRLSVATSPDVMQSDLAAAHNAVVPFLDIAPYVRGNEKITTWEEVFAAIEPEFERLWSGEQNALQTAERLKPSLQSLLEEGRGTD